MRWALFLAVAAWTGGCCSGKEAAKDASASKPSAPVVATTAKVIVYRTKKDYQNQVPVGLSADRSTIISYPDPKDLRSPSGGHPVPTELGKGWLLDNRGIGTNAAFLKMDYATYAALAKAPSLQELDSLIVDRDPLREVWDCGARHNYKDLVGELSAMARKNNFASRCKRLK